MSTVMTAYEPLELETERSQPHAAAEPTENETAHLSFSVDGLELDPTVESLDTREASFITTRYFDLFYDYQLLGPAVLSLRNSDVVVYPVVKSRNWPMIHVEFLQLSEKDRQMIARSTATSAGGIRPPANRRTYLATAP